MGANKSAKTGCPRSKATIWVSVKHTGTAAGIGGTQVSLTGPTPGQATTDGGGLAKFEARDPGAYKFSIVLPQGGKDYVVAPYSDSVSVGPGDVGARTVEAHRTGTLKVTVVDDANPARPVPGVEISASGPESVSHVAAQGEHAFGKVRAGQYTVSAYSDRPQYGPHEGPAVVVKVPDGGQAQARVVLPVVNIVSPFANATPGAAPRARDELWFLPAAAKAAPPGGVAAPASPHDDEKLEIKLSLAESHAGKPFQGHGRVDWDPAAVNVFSDAGCTAAVQPGLRVPKAQLAAGHKLYLKGKAAGGAQFTLTLGGTPHKHVVLRGPAEAAIRVREINVVTPVLAFEGKVVLFDRDLAQHELTPDGKKIRPQATWVDVSATQSTSDPKFTKGARLAAPNLDVFTDEKCEDASKFDLSKPIPNDKLFGAKPLRLWLKGKTKGKVEVSLTLEDPGDPRIYVKPPAKQEIGVVELVSELHRYDPASMPKVAGLPGPLATYLTNLKDAKTSDALKPLSDEKKVKEGRLLHLQDAGHYGRAKLVLKKLDAAHWPAGTDDYEITADLIGVGADTKPGATLMVFDKEVEGNEIALPAKVKVSALKAADVEWWVEGTKRSGAWRDVALDIGVSDGDFRKKHGDWSRFTVVQLKSVTFSVKVKGKHPQVWDAKKKRYFVNADSTARELKTDAAKGRTIEVKATLKPKLEGVRVHFMLAGEGAHRLNPAPADLPAGWDWGKIEEEVREHHRAALDDLLHVSELTDKDGVVKMEALKLSRFGGDKFRIGAYIDQDPHLAKYVHGHADLEKRRPVLSKASQTMEIWRKAFIQITRSKSSSLPSRTPQYEAFKSTFTKMVEVTEKKFDKASIPGLKEHPIWQFEGGTDTRKVICVGSHNSANFHGLFKPPTAETTPKAHLIMCEAQWDPEVSKLLGFNVSQRTVTLSMKRSDGTDTFGVFDPPLNGGAIISAGTSTWRWTDATGTLHSGELGAADIKIEKTRTRQNKVVVTVPDTCGAGCGCGGGTAIAPSAANKANVRIQVNGASGAWAGESGVPGSPHCLIVIDKNVSQFNNTIAHEMGHMFSQVRDADPWLGVPKHTDWYVKHGGQGDHCKKDATAHPTDVDEDGNAEWDGGTCIMYHVAVGNVTFCDQCKTDLRVRDLEDFFK